MVDYDAAGGGGGGPSCPVLDEPWADSDWRYRKKLIVDGAQVAGDLTDFPLLDDHRSRERQSSNPAGRFQ